MPALVLGMTLTPAGTHRGRAIVKRLIALAKEGYSRDCTADRGYTMSKPSLFHIVLRKADFTLTMDLAQRQRGVRSGPRGSLIIDGQIYSRFTPKRLHSLPAFRPDMTGEERSALAARYDERARYKYRARAYRKGRYRLSDPFQAGHLRSPQLPHTMRRSNDKPMINIPDGTDPATYNHSITVHHDELPLDQPTAYGTKAWLTLYGRRNATETANSMLKGGLTDLKPGHHRFLETSKITLAVALSIVGYNLHTTREWIKTYELDNYPTSTQGPDEQPTAAYATPTEPADTTPARPPD